jgi:hypothetical protein
VIQADGGRIALKDRIETAAGWHRRRFSVRASSW